MNGQTKREGRSSLPSSNAPLDNFLNLPNQPRKSKDIKRASLVLFRGLTSPSSTGTIRYKTKSIYYKADLIRSFQNFNSFRHRLNN